MDKRIKESINSIIKNLEKNKNFQILRKLSERDLELKYNYAFILYENDKTKEAFQEFLQLIIAKPFCKKYWFGLAATYQIEKKYTEAVNAWSICVILDNKDPVFHFHASECLFKQKKIEEAKIAVNESKARCKDSNLEKNIKIFEHTWLNNA